MRVSPCFLAPAAVAAGLSPMIWPRPAAAQATPPAAQVAVAPSSPAPMPPPPPRRGKTFGRRFDVLHTAGTSGVRLSRTVLDGSDDDDDETGSGMGAQLAGESERYGALGYYSARESGFGFIGGGAVGFEGGIGADMAWGVRVPFGPDHGPFFRAGMRGWLLGNDALYSSYFELPQLQLGYQWLTPGTVIELGWRAGPVLAGRYNTGDRAMRKLGRSFEVGGYAAVHASRMHLETGTTVVLESHREGPLHMMEGKLCGDAAVVRLCVDGRYFAGREQVGGTWAPLGESTQAFYGGFTVGVEHAALGALEDD
jgi:hypothetical protein